MTEEPTLSEPAPPEPTLSEPAPPEPTPPEPTMSEAAFYGGVGLAGAFAVTLAIGLSIIGFHVAGDSRDAPQIQEVEAAADSLLGEGGEIYSLRCSSCHGPSGEGGVGPSFVGVVERIPDPVAHEAIVREGRSQMPSFEGLLSDEQIALVVAFERGVLDGQ